MEEGGNSLDGGNNFPIAFGPMFFKLIKKWRKIGGVALQEKARRQFLCVFKSGCAACVVKVIDMTPI